MQLYNPILAWANQHFDVKFTVNDSIFGAHQSAETHQVVKDFLQGRIAVFSVQPATVTSLCNNCFVSMKFVLVSGCPYSEVHCSQNAVLDYSLHVLALRMFLHRVSSQREDTVPVTALRPYVSSSPNLISALI